MTKRTGKIIRRKSYCTNRTHHVQPQVDRCFYHGNQYISLQAHSMYCTRLTFNETYDDTDCKRHERIIRHMTRVIVIWRCYLLLSFGLIKRDAFHFSTAINPLIYAGVWNGTQTERSAIFGSEF